MPRGAALLDGMPCAASPSLCLAISGGCETLTQSMSSERVRFLRASQGNLGRSRQGVRGGRDKERSVGVPDTSNGCWCAIQSFEVELQCISSC